ncbi:M24 family metallopeptidase [Haloferula sargassicola]|uniref:Methionine aminopeptidase 1, mitochondrial n=1 Tax=Haloferula sargassicola TaxID=490096 RepID=A0ABP9UQU0_9BACT
MFISPRYAALPSDAIKLDESPVAFDYQKRRLSLTAGLNRHPRRPEVALIVDPRDILYLTGVHEGVSWLAVWDGGCFAVTRHMLVREVEEEIGPCEVLLPSRRSIDPVKLEAFVVSELGRRGLARIAFDPGRMNAASFLALSHGAAAAGMECLAVPSLVAALRQNKDPLEHHLISQCVEIAERAFLGLTEEGAGGLVGRSELELARELETRMIGLGADRQGFPDTGVIVASGPNSASAHHVPGRRRVGMGEPLLIDWGAELGGYRSDMTRTLFTGSVPDFACKAYPVVEAALAAAADVLAPGARMGDVDGAARDMVMKHGYPEFHYGVGHGVGLAIHEEPWLRANSQVELEEGMVTTVEPGIYLPGIGGIRIESMYSVSRTTVHRMDRLSVALAEMILD